jgi:hypothetical protein
LPACLYPMWSLLGESSQVPHQGSQTPASPLASAGPMAERRTWTVFIQVRGLWSQSVMSEIRRICSMRSQHRHPRNYWN